MASNHERCLHRTRRRAGRRRHTSLIAGLIPAVFVLFLCRIGAGAETLAEKLPPETILYAQVDINRIVEDGTAYLRFVDPEVAERVAFQIEVLHDALKQFLAAREFTPALLDALPRVKCHVVVMGRETQRNLDPNDGEGEPTDKVTFTTSVVVETPDEEMAADFLEQFKALSEWLREQHPGDELYKWREIQVDQGEMMAFGNDSLLGRFGRYLILSGKRPDKLWQALVAPARPSLADSDWYRRAISFTAVAERPFAYVLANTAELFRLIEVQMRRELQAIKKKESQKAGRAGDGLEEWDEPSWRMQRAQNKLDSFLMVKKLLSLDQLQYAGMRLALAANEQRAIVDFAASLQLGTRPAVALLAILDGGHEFEMPAATGAWEGMALFWRLGLSDLLDAVVEAADPQTKMQIQFAQMMVKTQTGLDFFDVIKQLAGDMYLFVDFTMTQREVPHWNQETRQMETRTVPVPQAQVLFLLGLNDPEAFRATLTQLFTQLAALGAGQFIKKQSYLGADAYLIGPGAGALDADPENAAAMAIVGRYLGLGTWKQVTSLIRRGQQPGPGGGKLAALVARHGQGNILLVVPRALNQKLQKMLQGLGQKNQLEQALEKLKDIELPLEDEQLAADIRRALVILVKDANTLVEKLNELGPELPAVHGRLKGRFYNLRQRSILRKDK